MQQILTNRNNITQTEYNIIHNITQPEIGMKAFQNVILFSDHGIHLSNIIIQEETSVDEYYIYLIPCSNTCL